MKQLTIRIKESNYSSFLALLKSMDFVSIVDDQDWYDILSSKEKESIHKGITDLDNGKTHSQEEVILLAKKKIAMLKEK